MSSIVNRERLEENLLFTNKEIHSNISRLARIVQDYEGIAWNEARKKASEISRANKTSAYVNEIRKAIREVNPEFPQLPVETDEPVRRGAVYEKNYDKLMELAPGLEAKLLDYQGEEIYGKSVRTGYMDFIIEFISLDQDSFFFTLAHFASKGGKRQPQPEMEVRIDVNKRKIEAISYEDSEKQVEVYEDKFNRDEVVNRKEKKAQNDFLANWLKTLKSQGHKIKWKEPDSTGLPPSEIIDTYQKKVEKEAPKEDEKPKGKPVEKTHEVSPLAEVISLSSALTDRERNELTERFTRLVSVNENLRGLAAVKKLFSISEKPHAIVYVLAAWEKMKQRDHEHLAALNYLRLHSLVPDLLETLKKEGGSIRLVSARTKTVFLLQLGDDRKANETVIGIYQQNGKTPEPTLLIRVHSDLKTISTDLSTNSFSGSADFNAQKKDPHAEGLYDAAIAFERWMKMLDLKEFKPVLVQAKKVDDHTTTVPEQEEHDPHYINKDIPDFEPGEVKLTEAHEKRGVTQGIIDRINRTREGVTLFPRTKDMIFNTRDVFADKVIKAKAPGFRLSATGKFYYEGRSNRADRTRRGL